MTYLKRVLLPVLIPLIMLSCKSSQQAVDEYRYFDKHLDTLNTLVTQMKEPVILQGDQLGIDIYSGTLNQAQVDVFKLGAEATGYTVDVDGNIKMPVIGKLHVEGLEKPAVEKLLEQKLEPFVKEPVVTIRFLNFKVLMMGEVGSPGFQIFNNEKVTVLDAIGQAGGLTETGRRTDILLIRQLPEGKKQYTRLDLNDAAIFASPYFQLKQNDIIYVLPNDSKLTLYRRANSPLFRDLPAYTGLIASLVSLLTIVLVFSRL